VTADEEMRLAYGEKSDEECHECANRNGDYCELTNRRRKCSDYGGFACGKYKKSSKHKFTVY
jgi:hypothetical protein